MRIELSKDLVQLFAGLTDEELAFFFFGPTGSLTYDCENRIVGRGICENFGAISEWAAGAFASESFCLLQRYVGHELQDFLGGA